MDSLRLDEVDVVVIVIVVDSSPYLLLPLSSRRFVDVCFRLCDAPATMPPRQYFIVFSHFSSRLIIAFYVATGLGKPAEK